MTSYKDTKSGELWEEMKMKEKELKTEIETVLGKLKRFMALSPAVQQMEPETWEKTRAWSNIKSYLQKEYGRVYVKGETEQVLPPFTIHQTNNPEVFADYLDTRNSMKVTCVSPPNSFSPSKKYAYEQNRWSPLYNLKIKLKNPGANYRNSVDFELEESYLLFGRQTNWNETHKKKDNGTDVERVVDEPSVRLSSSKEFMLFLYTPALPDAELFHSVTTLEEELERLTAPSQKEQTNKKGFFARLLGA